MQIRHSNSRKPILVSGAHRSGTTWVGQTLASAPGVAYIHEPLSLHRGFQGSVKPGIFAADVKYWFTHISEVNEKDYYAAYRHTLSFRYGLGAGIRAAKSRADLRELRRLYLQGWYRRLISRPRPLIKDPIAVLSADWLARQFDMDVIILIRHPAGFANSLIRLSWVHPFTHFLSQLQLMHDHLEPFRCEIEAFARAEREILDQAILLWRIIYDTVLCYRREHTHWLFTRYEDLAAEPVSGFRSLFAHARLPFSQPMEKRIVRGLRSNADGWKRHLNESQISRIKTGTADIWPNFYTEADW